MYHIYEIDTFFFRIYEWSAQCLFVCVFVWNTFFLSKISKSRRHKDKKNDHRCLINLNFMTLISWWDKHWLNFKMVWWHFKYFYFYFWIIKKIFLSFIFKGFVSQGNLFLWLKKNVLFFYSVLECLLKCCLHDWKSFIERKITVLLIKRV